MNIEEFAEYCLAKPGVEECFPFGPENLVLKVYGKIFTIADLEQVPLKANLKCDPEWALELRDEYEDIQPGYHMNKKHWNTVTLEGSLENKLIRRLIDHSYDLVVASVPAKLRKRPEA